MALTESDLPYTTTDSGLQFRALTEGEGDKPTATNTVTVHYTGCFENGEVFDSSIQRGEPTTFPMIKLRSMRADAEKGTGPVWAKQDDDRVTRVGRFIRKHRIDEIPQLLNVLLGQMSVVGPRPERAFIAEQFEEKIPGYSDRHVVQQPGITGWAQVQCGYDTSVEQLRDKVAHDLTYLAHLYSVPAYLKTELRVLRRTLSVVITGRGAQ